ncbi:predicted protein [Chaetomium globosum CBS 148.51]|uniref:Ubiquitin 3 binding protein But2 C-terminal domain-containing protein n=1 Tax=Chaetomium globosum (strain ATCC 6205 / CBS 148.51 / DSM 1962 / NBRC 6347 / NRRL 1970) TaxID=306901 RepID=Q2GY19_CHAGB|nr:uncharacterized protein CHGG_07135 [Chaetomium globosum CBS 148.51]EAQ85882.1 predicted protein [Chaetomium globosum CBS 148.51]
MHLTTTLTTLLLTTLTLALPTTTPTTHNHKKKEPAAAAAAATCAHIHPLSTPRLNLLNRPDLGLLSTQTLTFDLPTTTPNSTTLPGPCTLRAVFPPHWTITDSSVQAGGPPLAVDVYAVDGPAAGALVGTARGPCYTL